jgi:hypothetical protein
MKPYNTRIIVRPAIKDCKRSAARFFPADPEIPPAKAGPSIHWRRGREHAWPCKIDGQGPIRRIGGDFTVGNCPSRAIAHRQSLGVVCGGDRAGYFVLQTHRLKPFDSDRNPDWGGGRQGILGRMLALGTHQEGCALNHVIRTDGIRDAVITPGPGEGRRGGPGRCRERAPGGGAQR